MPFGNTGMYVPCGQSNSLVDAIYMSNMYCTAAGDTQGLVAADWSTILWNKIDYLKQQGLQPWYSVGSSRCAGQVTAPKS